MPLQWTNLPRQPYNRKNFTVIAQVRIGTVFDVNSKKQEYTVQMGIDWFWRDCSLQFNRSSNDGMVRVEDPGGEDLKHFWHLNPRIRETEHTEDDMRSLHVTFVWDGLVIFRERFTSTMKCPFDFFNYPFDRQNCTMHIDVSDAETGDFLKARWRGPSNDDSMGHSHPYGGLFVDPIQNMEWTIPDVEGWNFSVGDHPKVLPASRQPGKLPTLTLSFTLTRRSHFMVVNLIIPTILMLAMSYFGLFMDRAAAPARTCVHLTPLLIMVNRWSSFAQRIPPTDIMTWMDEFMLVHICLGSLQLLEYCIVNWAMHRAKSLEAAAKSLGSYSSSNDAEAISDGRQLGSSLHRRIIRFELSIVLYIEKWLEPASRVVFLVAYVLASILLFQYWRP